MKAGRETIIDKAKTEGIFDAGYAEAYDTVYGNKDYPRETDAVLRLLTKYGDTRIRSILDLGCGTGSYSVLLAERGYEVVGVDRSKPMLTIAEQRAATTPVAGTTQFIEGDIRSFASARPFDAAVMMFNVLGYMTSNDDLIAALNCVHANLAPNALFVFDIWYGPAILMDPPVHRFKEIKAAEGSVLRYASPTHDAHNQRCDVTIRVLRIVGDRITATSEEIHPVRYFFPLEIELALRATGFGLLALRSFPDIDMPPSLVTWSAIVVAKRT